MPLPVPQGVWTDVALDFVEALPRVRGKSVILTVVDRLSKYCHFIPLAHPYSAEFVAQAFFAEVVRLQGPTVHGLRQGPGLHVSILAGAYAANGYQTPHDDSIPSSVGRTV
jgi:hypothetical protein